MSSSNATDYSLATARLVNLRTENQVPAHKSFKPEAITPNNPVRLTVGDGPQTPLVGEPPEWTEKALCVGRWEEFDEPDAATFHKIVKPTCLACPVRTRCLSDALATEVDEKGNPVSGKFRAGVRGGLRTHERAALMVPRPAVCPAGLHKLTDETARMYDHANSWRCLPCGAARRAESRRVA